MPLPDPAAPLRVLYVNHVSFTGGAEKSLLRLLECVNRQQVTPILAAPAGSDLSAAAAALDLPFRPVSMRPMRRTLNPLSLAAQGLMLGRSAGQLARICRRDQIEAVHCNSLVAMLAARQMGGSQPLIWHARDLRAPRGAVLVAVQSAALIIAISRAVADYLLELAPQAATKLTVVYNGITPQDVAVTKSPEEIRREWRLPPTTPLVGCVGQMVAWKRQDLFLRAGARLVAQFPDVRLVVVGGDPHDSGGAYLSGLRNLAAQLGISDRVLWTGHRADIADVLAALDLLVHPATEEPLGRVIMEALALSVPVVAADSAGPAEIIEHETSGLLTASGEADALYQGMRRVLGHPDLAERLKTGGLQRMKHFLARDTAALTVELYAQLRRAQRTGGWRGAL